jgi:acetyl-CoA carboxylase biotin carboxyl carrier protein
MKIDTHAIKQLSAWISASGIDLLELTTPETSLSLRRDAPASIEEAPHYELTAPSLGIYLDRHPLSSQPLVKSGAAIEAGQLVGFLQIRSLLLPLRSARAGRIADLPQEHGNRLGYGDVVMRLLPEGRS